MKASILKAAILKPAILALLLAISALPTTPLAAAQATSYKQVPIPALPAFKPRQPKRIELSNGMVIFLQEDHELPLITLTARVRGGAILEPADKRRRGLSSQMLYDDVGV